MGFRRRCTRRRVFRNRTIIGLFGHLLVGFCRKLDECIFRQLFGIYEHRLIAESVQHIVEKSVLITCLHSLEVAVIFESLDCAPDPVSSIGNHPVEPCHRKAPVLRHGHHCQQKPTLCHRQPSVTDESVMYPGEVVLVLTSDHHSDRSFRFWK